MIQDWPHFDGFVYFLEPVEFACITFGDRKINRLDEVTTIRLRATASPLMRRSWILRLLKSAW